MCVLSSRNLRCLQEIGNGTVLVESLDSTARLRTTRQTIPSSTPSQASTTECCGRTGKFIQQRFLLDRNQQPIDVHEEEVTYVVGSGNHARSYLRHHPNGVITQLPVTWYSQQKRWDMSPGYEVKDHVDFMRAIPQGCVFCHTAYPRMDAKQIDDQHYFANPIPEGIGCERCHGAGARHVALAVKGESGEPLKQAIYNPGRDTPEAQRVICYQCHMESSVESLGTRVLKAERDVFSFRPGEPFSNYAVQFSLNEPNSKRVEGRSACRAHGGIALFSGQRRADDLHELSRPASQTGFRGHDVLLPCALLAMS